MHYIPGLRLRASDEAEILGIDDAEMGEFAYDYVGLEQEIGHSIPHAGVKVKDAEREEQKTVSSDSGLQDKTVDEKAQAQR
jgi:ammonium transporter, Amt family